MIRSAAAALALGAVTLHAEPVVFESTDHVTALLELFTSEGCSSCPPAEAWFSKLKTAEGLWEDYVPIAWHVDYWDYLGWRDPFAAKKHTLRQQAYADAWRRPSVYTPGFVLQGREWKGWGSEKPAVESGGAGILKAVLEKDDVTVTYTPPGEWEANVAQLGFDRSVPVKAGENSGRTLVHDFIVLDHQAQVTKQFPLKLKLPSVPSPKVGKLALAVWVCRPGKPAPVQATGGWVKH